MKLYFKRMLACLVVCLVALGCFSVCNFAVAVKTIEAAATVAFDDTKALPENVGVNILKGVEPKSIMVSTEAYGNIEKQLSNGSVGTITDGTVEKSWLAAGAKFADYNDGDVVCYENGEYCCDVMFMLKGYTDISNICIINHSNRQLVTGRYRIYASISSSTLFYDCNLLADVDNSESYYRQIISVDSSKIDSCRFVGIRFINPISNKYAGSLLNVTASTNNYYPRLSEFAVYGTATQTPRYTNLVTSGSSKTNVEDSLLSTVQPDLKKSLTYGKNVTVTCYKDGKTSVGNPNSSNLTDGDASTSWYCSTMKFGEMKDGSIISHRDDPNYYEDITVEMSQDASIGMIYIRNHNNSNLGLGHYEMYVSSSTSNLYTSANKIADFYNLYHYIDQYFTPNAGVTLKGKYIGIRVYDPCCDYYNQWLCGSYATTGAYPRLNEVAVFPLETATEIVKFSQYRLSGNAIGPVSFGTKAADFYKKYAGSGSMDVTDKNGNLVAPSSELESGSSVVASGTLGKTEKRSIAIAGDNNSDGDITVTDVVNSIDVALNGSSGVKYLASDTDCNGVVTVTDIEKQRAMIINGIKKITDTTEMPVNVDLYGTETTGSSQVSVDLSNVITSKFHSFGTNSFSATLSKTGMNATGYNPVYNELNAKRLVSVAEGVSRMWFQIDWMITNTETNSSVVNTTSSRDYTNYINGIYDFNGEYMEALYQYIEMLDAAGTEVEINFGWKTSQRIEGWFNAPTTDYKVGAPADLPAFGRAAAALINQLVNVKGYKNVKYISYYNEPNAGDFQLTETDEKAYWSRLIFEADKALKAAGVRNLVEFWGAEVAALDNTNTRSWMEYQLNNTSSAIDTWCGHHYYGSNYSNNYLSAFKALTYYAEKFSRNLVVTEMYGGGYHQTGRTWREWNDSVTGYFIAVSNTGTRGMFSWSTVGGYLPEPLYMKLYEGDGCAWHTPINEQKANEVNQVFYEQSLISNYITNNSKVLYTNWLGKDIKSSAYLLPDGNITVLVESNGYNSISNFIPENLMPKYIRIGFSDKINKTFYRFSYIPGSQVVDANCTVNPCDKTIDCKNGVITDSYDGNYGMYIYTTKKPIKQLALEKVQIHTSVGGTVRLSPRFIDCDSSEELIYSVTTATGSSLGAVSADGVYTASSSAKGGDMAAVRVALKSNPKVFAVAVIYIDN